ncbi:MAG: hypothetical protein IKD72_10575 [Clostridia bacterium]|nr:hypothetical protein [Clostridia bacterium]
MKNKFYSMAGLRIGVESERPVAESCYYRAFYADAGACDLTITVTEGEIPPRTGELLDCKPDRAFYHDGRQLRLFTTYARPGGAAPFACRETQGDRVLLTVDHPDGLWDSMLFFALNLPELLAEREIFLCHSSFILYRGEAVLFVGDKGAGKSTQAALWAGVRGAEIINGDRSLLRFVDGRLTAFGTPYCGSSQIALNRSAPVKAIILLDKGPDNRIALRTGMQALLPLLAQFSYESYQNAQATDFALQVCQSVPVYGLACRPEAAAVALLEKTLWQR